MEESLLKDLKLIQNIIDTAPIPIGVYVGEELRIVLANEAIIATWGKGHDVIGKYYTEVLPELKVQKIVGQALEVLKTGTPFHGKNCQVDIVIDGNLKTHFFNYSFTPLKDSHDTVFAVMNTATDVTDLNIARQQVEETEEKLRLAVSSAELGVYEIDLRANKFHASTNFCNLWGVDENATYIDLINKIHPDDLSIRNKAHENALKTGNLSYEVRILRKSNSLSWIRINGKILFDVSGSPLTILGVAQDITDQKEFSNELQDMVAERTTELKKSNEDLLHFANIVSHDLKEPVRKIKIFNNLIKNELVDSLSEKSLVYFDKVQHSTERMTAIIEDVLKYSTLNKQGYPVERIDLSTIIENIKTDLELIIQEKRAILIKDELPQIVGAPILIHQLFYNLIHNALKFSKVDNPPRVIVTCSLTSIEDVACARISIKDNGIGFNPEYAQKIFDAFERLHSKDEFEGTGLGLSLCKKIVERHKGTVEATGDQNNGAEFIICLPLEQYGNKI